MRSDVIAEGLRFLVDREDQALSCRDQCESLELNRSTYNYTAAIVTEANPKVIQMIDRQYLETPLLGIRKWLPQTVRSSHQGLDSYPDVS